MDFLKIMEDLIMKQTVIKYFGMALLTIMSVLGFSSCEDYTSPPPPGGNSSSIDPYLIGTWELTFVNGHRVNGYEVNYLDFYSNGSGYYYYYDYGMEYELGFDFWSEYRENIGYLFINYYDGVRAKMTYYFMQYDKTLVLKWWENNMEMEYVYYYVSDMYWSPQKDTTSSTFALRPGATTLDRLNAVSLAKDSVGN